MRISDWSSDVCSSDLDGLDALAGDPGQAKQLGAPGILADRLPQRGLLLLAGLGVQRVHLVEGDDLGLFGEAAAVGLQLPADGSVGSPNVRSEEHTSELQSLMRNSYAVFCLKKKKIQTNIKV